MTKTLIIAEKPSVAQDIARALTPVAGKFDKAADHFENERYVITSAVGHLVEIAAPEEYDVKRGKWSFAHLPVLPPHFDLAPIDKAKSRLQAVVRLIKRKDVTDIINACDAGREGELIFRLILQYAQDGSKAAAGKPVRRLWLQSMTPQAIRDGFDRLRSDADMQGLADAARSRSEADWLVGINGTRAMTAFNSSDGGFFLTTVGRVQTPTLSIVVEREEKIRRHVARDYWEIKGTFAAAAGRYDGKWIDTAFGKAAKAEDPEARADRLWDQAKARAIAAACEGRPATVQEESKPSTQASPGLYDLTTLQREANGRFGFSAKTTLQLAQSLYEKHKALTYPRTDSRHLPEDYLATVKQTVEMLASADLPAPLRPLAQHARNAAAKGYIKPSKRVFDNSKVSDHFAIIPTLQPPGSLSEAEAKLYDLVVKRFLAVFYPSAEYLVTTRLTTVDAADGSKQVFQTNGKVLQQPGWLAVYGKEAQDDDAMLVAVQPGEKVRNEAIEVLALRTKPPARYTEATLLSAMEGAGKLIDDDELREAMQERGLGTPATRAATIEGLISEKYLLREGRELIPTAKAFQLMTLLRGLEVEDLTKPELTGAWEYQLRQMEDGRLSRAKFMAGIADMAERIVAKAKGYDRDTIPGDYATLAAPCPNCGGVVKENYRRYTCLGKAGAKEGCGFSVTKIPAGRGFEPAEIEQLLTSHRIGPLEGFRSKAGWPFTAELRLVQDDEAAGRWKMEFDFGQDQRQQEADGEAIDFSGMERLGNCPKCGQGVYEHGSNYVCEAATGPAPTCTFKTGRVILQLPIEAGQLRKLLASGATDLLDGFISNRTRRKFKARLQWDAAAGQVAFAFEPRPAGAKTAARRGATGAEPAAGEPAGEAVAAKAPARKAAAKKATARKSAAKKATARKTAARKATGRATTEA